MNRIVGHDDGRVICSSGKLAWPTKAAAKRKLKDYQSRGGGVRSIYKCPECGSWHMTSQGKGGRAVMQRLAKPPSRGDSCAGSIPAPSVAGHRSTEG